MKVIRIILASLAVVAGSQLSAAPVIVTHSSVATDAIDADTIKAVFRGKKVTWADKTRVVVAILDRGETHEAFLKVAFNISPSAFANHWRLTAMSGGGVPPKTFASEEELLSFVATTPGAIGYVDATHADDRVKQIAID